MAPKKTTAQLTTQVGELTAKIKSIETDYKTQLQTKDNKINGLQRQLQLKNSQDQKNNSTPPPAPPLAFAPPAAPKAAPHDEVHALKEAMDTMNRTTKTAISVKDEKIKSLEASIKGLQKQLKSRPQDTSKEPPAPDTTPQTLQYFSPLTHDQKLDCIQLNICFRCRQPGHRSYHGNCPNTTWQERAKQPPSGTKNDTTSVDSQAQAPQTALKNLTRKPRASSSKKNDELQSRINKIGKELLVKTDHLLLEIESINKRQTAATTTPVQAAQKEPVKKTVSPDITEKGTRRLGKKERAQLREQKTATRNTLNAMSTFIRPLTTA